MQSNMNISQVREQLDKTVVSTKRQALAVKKQKFRKTGWQIVDKEIGKKLGSHEIMTAGF